MAMNKSIFEENWKTIRAEAAGRWNLVSDFDLHKVEKAEDKYDRFVTMLQVKYGLTRQQAREDVHEFWLKCKANKKNSP